MAEVTRVPIQPIRKGSLTKLWLGIAVALAAALALAWFTIPRGVSVEELTAGAGEGPGASDVVFVRYTGKLEDGTVFDQSQDIPLPVEGIFPGGTPLPLEGMIPGFTEAALQMKKGGKYRFEIPADKAYGAEGSSNPQTGEQVIPPNSDLTFEVELVDFMSREDFERRVQAIQQMMQMQQGANGAPGGAPGAPGAPNGAPAPAQPGQ
jgi:FKBP-type peptidyl-prolyl cis-trans isomerase FkpA